MRVTKLFFCQIDSPMSASFWQKNRMDTQILFDLCLIEHFSPVANFAQQSIYYGFMKIRTKIFFVRWADATSCVNRAGLAISSKWFRQSTKLQYTLLGIFNFNKHTDWSQHWEKNVTWMWNFRNLCEGSPAEVVHNTDFP